MMDLFFRLSGGGERPIYKQFSVKYVLANFHPKGGSIAGGCDEGATLVVTSRAHRLAEGAQRRRLRQSEKVQWQPGSLSVDDSSCCCCKKEHGPRNRRIPKAPDRRSSSSSPTEPALVRAVCASVRACVLCYTCAQFFFLLFLASMMTSMDSEDQSSAASPTDVSHDPGYVPLLPLTSVACQWRRRVCVYHSFLIENNSLINRTVLR